MSRERELLEKLVESQIVRHQDHGMHWRCLTCRPPENNRHKKDCPVGEAENYLYLEKIIAIENAKLKERVKVLEGALRDLMHSYADLHPSDNPCECDTGDFHTPGVFCDYCHSKHVLENPNA